MVHSQPGPSGLLKLSPVHLAVGYHPLFFPSAFLSFMDTLLLFVN